MPEDWDKKLEYLKKATAEHPNDGLAWSAFGDFLCDETENPNLAVRAYERAQELLPERDLRLRLGRAYVRNGESDRGITMIQASAVERPRAEAYCFLADAYQQCGQAAKAAETARIAIQLEPSFEEGYFLLGEALKDNDQTAAIEAFRTAVSLDDNYALAWQALGRELIHGGNLQEGVTVLTKAVNLDPGDVWSRIFLADGLRRLARLREAEEQYLAALALAPEFPDLHRWYEAFLQERKRAENR